MRSCRSLAAVVLVTLVLASLKVDAAGGGTVVQPTLEVLGAHATEGVRLSLAQAELVATHLTLLRQGYAGERATEWCAPSNSIPAPYASDEPPIQPGTVQCLPRPQEKACAV